MIEGHLVLAAAKDVTVTTMRSVTIALENVPVPLAGLVPNVTQNVPVGPMVRTVPKNVCVRMEARVIMLMGLVLAKKDTLVQGL